MDNAADAIFGPHRRDSYRTAPSQRRRRATLVLLELIINRSEFETHVFNEEVLIFIIGIVTVPLHHRE